MKVTYQNSAMRMRLEMTGMLVYSVTDHRKRKRLNRTNLILLHQFDVLHASTDIIFIGLSS